MLHTENHLLLIKRGEILSEIHVPIWKYTDVGKELLPLVHKPLSVGYFDLIGMHFVRANGTATFGEIRNKQPDGTIEFLEKGKVVPENDTRNTSKPSM